MSTELNAIVTQRIEVSPGLAIIRVVPKGWELGEFSPTRTFRGHMGKKDKR